MKLERWALIAEIFSAAAVVVSLIFVGFQVRQGADETALNTRAIEVSAYQDLTAQVGDLNRLLIENPALATARSRVLQGDSLQSIDNSEIAEAYLRLAFRQGDTAYRQYVYELIDEPTVIRML